MFLPKVSSWRRLPLRKPSPTPASSSSDPTPQAMPNMVRKERSLCAHRVRKVWVKMSRRVRIGCLRSAGAVSHGRYQFDCRRQQSLALDREKLELPTAALKASLKRGVSGTPEGAP